MIITLTHSEMLAQWKLRRVLEPLRDDCAAVRRDGIDLDRLLALEMRDWYLQLLDTAPAELTGVTDIAADVDVVMQPDGSGVVALPEGCRRVVAVTMKGWRRGATVVTDPDSPLAMLQTCRHSRGGTVMPVAVVDGSVLRLYTPPDGDAAEITELKCVMEPPEGVYRMDERALSSIAAYTPTGDTFLSLTT